MPVRIAGALAAGLVAPLVVAPAAQAQPAPAVFVNEFHYDNAGGDTGEFVEIAGPPGTDVSSYRVVLYNGNGGVVYGSPASLSGTLDEDGVVAVPIADIQNGPIDALALVDGETVVQFLSYGGGVVAGNDGPAAGLNSTDVGVAESPAPEAGQSLQLTGTGEAYGEFTWTGPAAASPGAPNTGQRLTAAPVGEPGDGPGEEPGVPGDVSAVVAAGDPAVGQVVEGESLAPSASGPAVSVRTSCCGVVWSGNQQLRLAPENAGQVASLVLEVPVAGRYAVAADLTRGPDYGTVEVAIDGNVVGTFEGYAATTTIERRVDLGELELEAGAHTLSLNVTGKDVASTGLLAGLDLLRLRRLPEGGRLMLTPQDGTPVRGMVPVYGWSTDPADTLTTEIDGEDVPDRPALGESATLVFEGEGIQAGPAGADFADGIEVRGRRTVMTYDVGPGGAAYATHGIDISGELLAPGPNTVTIFTGPDPAVGPDSNMDNFQVRNVRLVLPDGTVLTDPAMGGNYPINDGNQEEEFTFTIPASSVDGPRYIPGRGYNWDTSAVADGEHFITLTAQGTGGPETITSTVTVDNTAPTISDVTPADGTRLKGEAVLDATAGDGTADARVTATIDGESVELGSPVSSDDLGYGEHTFAVTATDAAGNTTTVTSRFTSVPQTPAAPELVAPLNRASDVPTDAELRVRASDPDGDALDVTFLEAVRVAPDPAEASTGSTSHTPSVLEPEGSESLTRRDVDSASASDNAYVEAAPSTGFPYQRYDVQVDDSEGVENVDVVWEGRVAADREVVLSVWDMQAEQWTPVARGRGLPSGDTVVSGTTPLSRALDGDVVHVLVQGRDPFADVEGDEPDEQFENPQSYDFSLAWLTDTQYLSQGAEAGRTAFGDAYRDINEWIVDNADERKIVYTAHTGDIINDWTTTTPTPEYEARARREFQFASDTMAILEAAGMPYGVTPGNHDNQYGASNVLYNEYFGPERFVEASTTAEQDYYGAPWRPGDNQNHYDLFEAAGQKFIAVYVGFLGDQAEIDWANEVLQEHADRKAIFLTHSYLMPSSDPQGRNGAYVAPGAEGDPAQAQGEEFFREVVLPNENVFLTLSGHTHGVATNIKRDVGEEGRTVVEMLANYQFYEVEGERRTGFLRLLQFDLAAGEIAVNTYSPTLDDHNADEYDTGASRDYSPAADEFRVPVDLETRSTSFSTDMVGLTLRTDQVIGTDAVDSGEQAATTWQGLEASSSYSWYAQATDEFGATAESPVFRFVTQAEEPPGDPGEVPDTTPPTVEVEVWGSSTREGVYDGPVQVTTTATDEDGSAAAVIECRADDGDWMTYSTALDFAEPGEYRVSCRAADEAGNVSEPMSVSFTIVSVVEEPAEIEERVQAYLDQIMQFRAEGRLHPGVAARVRAGVERVLRWYEAGRYDATEWELRRQLRTLEQNRGLVPDDEVWDFLVEEGISVLEAMIAEGEGS